MAGQLLCPWLGFHASRMEVWKRETIGDSLAMAVVSIGPSWTKISVSRISYRANALVRAMNRSNDGLMRGRPGAALTDKL